ncbi:glycosyltransferase family 2 protein [Gallibacterium anatis]|uniref:glycosyltransferase family 2 protein n=1 Tax=Gallibacterium anatis TaxID=750 RepID=UPI00068DA2AC|nr:glycosyltransferase family 2 protein [Gallibacterium anatis]
MEELKESELISVIVPVYNVENYLEDCITSLLNQTYQNIEIILVNDGSTDSSGKICEIFAFSDSRIKVFHKSNGGSSSARNLGISKSTGDYIGFIDSDDTIDLRMYEYLYKLIKKYSADSSEINYRVCNRRENTTNQRVDFDSCKEYIYQDKAILEYYMLNMLKTGNCSVCTCLFRKDLLKSISFREGKVNEDIDYKFKVLRESDVFVVSDLKMYNYFQRSESNSNGVLRKKDFDLYESAEELYLLAQKENNEKLEKLAEVKKARTAFSLLSRIAYFGISDEFSDKEKTVNDLLIEHRKNLYCLIFGDIPLSRKALAILYFINFPISIFFIKILKLSKRR